MSPTADQLRQHAAALKKAIERKRRSIVRALTDAGIARLLDDKRDLERELADTLRSIPAVVARESKSTHERKAS